MHPGKYEPSPRQTKKESVGVYTAAVKPLGKRSYMLGRLIGMSPILSLALSQFVIQEINGTYPHQNFQIASHHRESDGFQVGGI